MKKAVNGAQAVYRCVALMLLLLLSVNVFALEKDNLMLVVYSTNAEVLLVLSSKDAPDKVLASARAMPGQLYRSDIQSGETVKTAAFDVVGHPANLKFNDSPLVAFAAALDQLRLSVETLWPELKQGQPLKLADVLIGIAGYDRFHLVRQKAVTKDVFYKIHFVHILKQRHFELAGFHQNMAMMGDQHLVARASRQKDQSLEECGDVDLVHLTTYAQGYRVRGGKLMDLFDNTVLAASKKNGGYFSFGRQVQADYLYAMPAEVSPDYFKNVTSEKKPVFLLLNQVALIRAYEEINMGAQLNNPGIGYEVKDLPTKKHAHYLSRVKNRFMNELGYLSTEAILMDQPSALSDEVFQAGRRQLLETAGKSVVAGVAEAVVKLGKNTGFPNDPGPLKGGHPVPLVLIGEYPMQHLPGLQRAIEDQVAQSGVPLRPLNVMTSAQFQTSLSKAAVHLIEEERSKPFEIELD